MNILILSCGTRNKVVKYFKENGVRTVATDCSPYAPALYEADTHYIVPRMTADGYLDVILGICGKEHIDAVISLIDPELSLLALNAEAFKKVGATVVGSPYELCELALDKWSMYEKLSALGFGCARTYIDFDAFKRDADAGIIGFPVFVKPRFGSASIAISKAPDMQTARFLFEHGENMIVQEFLNGQEIGADCYIDMITGECVRIFTKKKLVMRAGETDKAVSFRDDRLFSLIECFTQAVPFRGMIDIDIFDIDGRYLISEVNPRFGGGYPHAYECGVNTVECIKTNIGGSAVVRDIGSYRDGVVMMKYNEVMILGKD